MKSGWQTSTLGDVLAVLRNGVTCKQDKSGRGNKISRIESISDASFDLGKVGYANLSERDKERYLLQPGDILFSHINSAVHVGKTAVFDSDELVYHGMNLLLMRPKDVVTSAYLEHALKFLFQSGYWRGVCKQSINQASVNQQDISRVQISYPKSHAEQQRIVGILDEAFEGIATAKANAEKNLQNAHALFESHLQSVFTQHGKGWEEKRLGDVCQIKPPKVEARDRLSDKELVSFVPMEDLGIDLKIFLPTQAKPLSEVCGSYTYFADGDVLLAKITPCFENGKLGIAANLTNGIGFGSSEYIVFRPGQSVDKEWLYYFLSRNSFRKVGAEHMNGAVGHKRVSKEFIEAYLIPVPTITEQQHLAEQLDSLSAETQRLESIYQQKLDALNELKKSLLHQAFTGDL